MGAWAYCKKCQALTSLPSLGELARGSWECQRCETMNPHGYDIADVIDEIEQRLTALEEKEPERDA